MSIEANRVPDIHRIDDIVVDAGQRRVFRGNQEIQLPRLSFAMLLALIEAAPNALSIDELTDQVWDGTVVSSATVAKRIELLRQALGEDSQNSRYIALVRGHGYRLIPSPESVQRTDTRRKFRSSAVVVAVVAIVAGTVWYLVGDTEPPPARSIAVLPFANLGLEAESEYLSDGLATELTSLLTTIPELKVAARTSAFAFKGRDVQVTDIAKQLRVSSILSGSVQQSGDRLRIAAQLIDAGNGYHIWSNSWDRELADIFQIQDEIAAAVIESLQLQLLQDMPLARQADPEAYTYYLKGKKAFLEDMEPNIGSPQDERHARALSLTTHALAIDPDYAPAWGQLARIQFNQAQWMLSNQAEAYARAEASAHRAVALDAGQADALSALGNIFDAWYWDAESAAKWYKRALTVAPGNSNTLNAVSVLYWRLGQPDIALRYQLEAYDRDPLNRTMAINLARAYGIRREFDTAKEQLGRARQIAPDAIRVQVVEALLAYLEGNYEKAAHLFEETNKPLFACSLLMLERLEEALAELEKLRSTDSPGAYGIATVYVCRNDRDSAFTWLQRAYDEHEPALRWIRDDVIFANLHDDTRWAELVQKIGVSDDRAYQVMTELDDLGH